MITISALAINVLRQHLLPGWLLLVLDGCAWYANPANGKSMVLFTRQRKWVSIQTPGGCTCRSSALLAQAGADESPGSHRASLLLIELSAEHV